MPWSVPAAGASAGEIGPCPSCCRISAPIVTVEPTLHGERQVLDASALLRLYLADGPLLERLEEAADLLAELQRLPLRTMASLDLCSTVLQLSKVQRISVYDAIYQALALRYGAILLTADQQLAGAAGRAGCGG